MSFFSETMARNRFGEILRFLRFDMRSTRSIRLQADKFALVSDLWNKFVDNCISSYKPGPNITIDEQLFPTKARCRFTQYMPNKPDKFGIKFWLAVDVDTKYILNAIPYLGKEESRAPSQRLSDWVVMNLMQPYLGKGRNVTTDNFFTSYSLAKQLLQKKTSIVGTVNKVRRELPPSAKKQATRYSTVLLKTDDVATLTIYQCKPTKNVCFSLACIDRWLAKNEQRKTFVGTNQHPPQRGGAVPGPVWVGSKWLLAFPRVPVTPGTPHFFAMLPPERPQKGSTQHL